tara:strand:+ start:63881 stop:64291 length:411 start_codon:yes stop_codon:yes gene_type:complete
MTNLNHNDLLAATEDIFAGMSNEPVPTGARAIPVQMDDIRGVVLSDALVENFVNFALGNDPINEGAEPTLKEIPEANPRVANRKVIEAKVTSLIGRLTALLKEAKETIAEMTSVGMIGVNTAPVQKKKRIKKRGST